MIAQSLENIKKTNGQTSKQKNKQTDKKRQNGNHILNQQVAKM